MLVCSKAPLGCGAAAAAAGDEWVKIYIPPFELGADGMVLYKLDDSNNGAAAAEGDNRVGPTAMKEMVLRRLKEISQSSRVPAMYCRAMDGVLEWVKERAVSGSGGKIVGRRELEDRIKNQDNRLANDPGLLERAVRYMKGGGMISYSNEQSECVVLEPLSWLPRLLALFVASEAALHSAAPISVDEFGFAELNDVSRGKVMDELDLENEAHIDPVIELMESFGLSHRDRVNPNRLYLPFTLKPTADWLVKPHEVNGVRVLGRFWKCVPDIAFPPGFFCQLQLGFIRVADDSSNRNIILKKYPQFSNNLRLRDSAGNSGEVLHKDKQVLLLVMGPSPSSLLEALFVHVDKHIRSYPGLSDQMIERWTLCPKCVKPNCQPVGNDGRPVKLIGVRVEVKSDHPEAQYITEWTLPNAEQCHHDHVSIKELLTEGCKFVFCSFPSFVFCTFCRMPNNLAIDAHPLPAGETRVNKLEENVADIVLDNKDLRNTMIRMRSELDKR